MNNFFSPPVIDINLELLEKYSIQLADLIINEGFKPDHILFIERAGLLIGDIVANYLRCEMSGIATKRSGNGVKAGIKNILRYLPRFITHFLRRAEIHSNIHEVKSERKIVIDYPLPCKKKKILLIDDAIDTGNSIKAVIDYLINKGYSREQIKIAVITTTGKEVKYKADFSLFNQVICAFPWSYDSREFDKAWSIYFNKKSLLCQKI